MFKQLSKLCIVLAFVALPFATGCVGRPAPPVPSAEAEGKDFGQSSEETTFTDSRGNDLPANDGAQPID